MPKVTGCGEIGEIERGEVCRIRHHLGKGPATGKHIRSPKRTVCGAKSDAGRALEDYRRELESGFANPDEVTVPELGWKRHEQRKLLKDLSPLTHKTDEREVVRDGRAAWVEEWRVTVSSAAELLEIQRGAGAPIAIDRSRITVMTRGA
ncbi:hypothetical protein B5F40_08825 [Gordonibacter sp. An230]|uniref:hypothetical protein n=1 Tax=Gordonibacter sp. An230 TaxID=1965592 RepID=UPI000B3789D2|nr:hypothetical protein [Gordonibacter sp. An230]OUO89928.1 hypothetical protein B5F40_08825 [Gordonibacter sp. An230]